jgi:hypothetical protein
MPSELFGASPVVPALAPPHLTRPADDIQAGRTPGGATVDLPAVAMGFPVPLPFWPLGAGTSPAQKSTCMRLPCIRTQLTDTSLPRTSMAAPASCPVPASWAFPSVPDPASTSLPQHHPTSPCLPSEPSLSQCTSPG